MKRHRHQFLGSALVALAVAAGCGDDGNDANPEAQPGPDVTRFVEGDFGDIPIPPLAEPAGERSERSDVTAQSFFVRNTTPKGVIDFYANYFETEGASVIEAPSSTGPDAWRGVWLVDGRELLVSTILAPTAEGAEVEHADVVTQLDLELSPAGGGGHQGGPSDETP